MVARPFWQDLVEEALRERSVVWLAGVRRAGKTMLCQSLKNIEYFDCELPSVRRILADPETFLESVRGKRIVLDEIHRLPNPSEILKIAADHFADVRIVATGSSTLGASRLFRDTLTGRKRTVFMTPMIDEETITFDGTEDQRMLHGGLPPYFLASTAPEREMQEWIDSYWAKDIQTLFHLEKQVSFRQFVELIFARSGGMFQSTAFAKLCEVSHGTIRNYLQAMETTFVAHVIRPFSSHTPTEIVSTPKVYGFDTGFVCAHRGWKMLRMEDCGILFEHMVLNELIAHLQSFRIHYWRDKQGHEIDFVLPGTDREPPIAIECKWNIENADLRSLRSFLRRYPKARAFLVGANVSRPWVQNIVGVPVECVSLSELLRHIANVK